MLETNSELFKKIRRYEPVFWHNPYKKPAMDALKEIPLGLMDVEDALERLNRFSPVIKRLFPEASDGIIESRHLELKHAMDLYGKTLEPFSGTVLLKLDNYLPISKSVKARGGIYEVLWFADQVALREGIITLNSDYSILLSTKARDLFRNYSLVVGSTGNLGLSVGIMGRALGFSVEVHMSKEAAAWKKDKLRNLGVKVVEHEGDYSAAVAEARRIAMNTQNTHFVDDEQSVVLFLGYSVAALRLVPQIEPLLAETGEKFKVYLPCGVGGAPGGIAFGLKTLLGDKVEVYFAEPTHCPCMLLGLASGKLSNIAVADIGLDGITVADGLAVCKPSKLTTPWMYHLIDGVFTVPDDFMVSMVRWLWEREHIKSEPSANAGFYGLTGDGIHLVWLTGGGMVPDGVFEGYLSNSKDL
jgi:D-serine dehydratase